MPEAVFAELTRVDVSAWQSEVELHADWFDKLKDRLPSPLRAELELLTQRLRRDAA